MDKSLDYSTNQYFVDPQGTTWTLLDISEVKSLLNSKKKPQIVVHLLNKKDNRIVRINFVKFESNYRLIESGLAEQVSFLENCFALESD